MEIKKYGVFSKIKARALMAGYYILLGLISCGTLAIVIYALFIMRAMEF
jgi:hypothetical protein